MRWRASWSTTCGTTGTLRPVETSHATDGTSALTRPTTTTTSPWSNGSPSPCKPPRTQSRDKGRTTRRIRRNPHRNRRGTSHRIVPRTIHGGGSGYQNGDQEWSSPTAPQWGTDARAGTYGRADQRNSDPWQGGETQGSQDGRRDRGGPLLGDPWGAYKKSHQGPRETQRSDWNDQHWQRMPSPTEEPNSVRQPGRRGPRWEQLWWEGKSHTEMRLGG